MQTLCPFCAKSISESADVCPNCNRNFKEPSPKGSFIRRPPPEAPPGKPPPKKERDLPPHMVDAMNAPMEEAESVLPPHMLAGMHEAAAREARPPEPKGSPALLVGTGVVILAAAVILPWIKPAPTPVVVVVPPEPAQPPAPPAQPAPEPPAVEKKEAPPAPPPKRPPPRPKPVRRKPAPVQAAAAAPAARAAPPPVSVPRPTKWRLRGRLLNLVTLEPVADADIVFLDGSSGQRFMSATGPNGSFRISLPPSYSGYALQIRHPDYDSKYMLEDGTYGSMSQEQRQQIADQMGQHGHREAEPLKAEDDGSLDADIVVVPRPKHGMTLEEALAR